MRESRPLLLDAGAVEARMLALAAERGAMLPALTPDDAKALVRDLAWCLVGEARPRPLGEVVRRITPPRFREEEERS